MGGSAAYLGSLMITKRMALVGDALGHVALPGMGLALLMKVDPSLGAFVFLAIGIFLIWKLGENSLLSLETLVGIVFVTSLALGFLIVPQPELLESLIGDISKIDFNGMVLAVLASITVFLVVRRLYPGMMLIDFSADLASVEGISEKRHNLLYLAMIALIVSVGVKITGSLLVGVLVIIPPAAARIISNRLRQYARYSALLGAVSGVVGISVSHWVHFPAGPAIILTSSIFFLAAFLSKRLIPSA